MYQGMALICALIWRLILMHPAFPDSISYVIMSGASSFIASLFSKSATIGGTSMLAGQS